MCVLSLLVLIVDLLLMLLLYAGPAVESCCCTLHSCCCMTVTSTAPGESTLRVSLPSLTAEQGTGSYTIGLLMDLACNGNRGMACLIVLTERLAHQWPWFEHALSHLSKQVRTKRREFIC